jgi:hypothetical protein
MQLEAHMHNYKQQKIAPKDDVSLSNIGKVNIERQYSDTTYMIQKTAKQKKKVKGC